MGMNVVDLSLILEKHWDQGHFPCGGIGFGRGVTGNGFGMGVEYGGTVTGM